MNRTTILAVLVLLSGCAHGKAPEGATSAQVASKGDAKTGQKIFGDRCASCHGPAGKGNGDDAIFYQQRPRDFTAVSFKGVTDAALFDDIRHGKGDMLPFDKRLSEGETWDVIAYLRTFQQ